MPLTKRYSPKLLLTAIINSRANVDPVFFNNLKVMSPSKQKIRIKLRAYDHKIIDDSAKLIIDTAVRTGAIINGPIPLPTKIEKYTVNKSTFVHKNSREQFEIRTHKRLIDISESTPKTIENLSNLTLPAGVDIEIKMLINPKGE